MAISVSIIMMVAGLISLFTLPVEQYPDIAPPTVYVSTSYTGADADAVMQSVVMPLEEAINGVENMYTSPPMPRTMVRHGFRCSSSKAPTPTLLPSTCRTVSPRRRACCQPK